MVALWVKLVHRSAWPQVKAREPVFFLCFKISFLFRLSHCRSFLLPARRCLCWRYYKQNIAASSSVTSTTGTIYAFFLSVPVFVLFFLFLSVRAIPISMATGLRAAGSGFWQKFDRLKLTRREAWVAGSLAVRVAPVVFLGSRVSQTT